LRELVLHACNFHALKKGALRQRHLIDLITDQLEVIQTVPLQLPHLSDQRARHVAEILLAEPANTQRLSQLCRGSGASKRTVERLFEDEVGMTFGKWRQQLRLMHAVRLLAEGAKVTHAALEAGYSTPSAFICMFKKVLGFTPAMYFKVGA
jgi:AraC-like DNA-binding protein